LYQGPTSVVPYKAQKKSGFSPCARKSPASNKLRSVPDKIHCDTHGDSEEAYVCTHLTGEATGLGFNRDDPTEDNPFPDAWCDNCEIIRAASGGWNEESEKLASISLLCSGCYERARTCAVARRMF
jgi:hypothetical protein